MTTEKWKSPNNGNNNGPQRFFSYVMPIDNFCWYETGSYLLLRS